jgi:predicted enzyme related to lactoylglutathione lyase
VEERRGRVDAEVERLLGIGATRLRTAEEPGGYWVVMQDPEGNEFCVH